MTQNNNLPTVTTGTGVALKSVNKSLRITNKLLAQVDDFETHWAWWLSLDDAWRVLLLKYGIGLDCVDYEWTDGELIITQVDIDWLDKVLMKDIIQNIIKINQLSLSDIQISDVSALVKLTNLTELRLTDNQISDVSALAMLTNLTWLYLPSNPIAQSDMAWLQQQLPNCSISF